MNFIDLAAQQKRIRSELDSAIRTVLDHGQYIMGPEIKQLEERLARYAGTSFAVSCASGTDALLMALMAYGVGPGDAIYTTPFTFVATSEVISLLGATPVFVDIDPITFNIDPDKLENAIKSSVQALTPRGVITVDLFGVPADYRRINEIAKKCGLFVIEDAAQSFGADYYGQKACSLADVACTSFFPAKPLGCYGDGGAIFTNDPTLHDRLLSIRIHGQGADKYENIRIGINGRMDTLQAAILNVKLDIFPEEVKLRNQVAEGYRAGLAECEGLVLPQVPENLTSVWAQYSILADSPATRSLLLETLKSHKIPTAIYYPKPLHLQDAFAKLGYKPGSFPVAEDSAGRIFSIPMHPYLSAADQDIIMSAIKNAK